MNTILIVNLICALLTLATNAYALPTAKEANEKAQVGIQAQRQQDLAVKKELDQRFVRKTEDAITWSYNNGRCSANSSIIGVTEQTIQAETTKLTQLGYTVGKRISNYVDAQFFGGRQIEPDYLHVNWCKE